ncbi:hypothetical protein BUALT_Bualt07G0102300 [Buddleja alternifolia]|uniref:FAR1 domain-containing protein n=1 Tax=Buddleja alternifolia TaxID=168488 RepID=A0AAV6X9S0_9LAMI|nr:hypothetical protein BUALT_Bualt07G0102300 [Buddleja alternifolia]
MDGQRSDYFPLEDVGMGEGWTRHGNELSLGTTTRSAEIGENIHEWVVEWRSRIGGVAVRRGTSCPIIDINEESLDEVSANLTSKKVLSDNCLSQLESRLDVGQLFFCPDEAYKLYVKYAISKGFSVRKGKNYTFWRSSEIRAKTFLCNKQGESKGKGDKENETKQYHNLDTREKCEVMLYIAPWKIIKFIKQHTHELAAHDEIHLLKSARKISESKAGTLESMVNAGIKAIHAFNYMEKECGGPEKIGFLKKDAYNLINQIRNSRIAGGDF